MGTGGGEGEGASDGESATGPGQGSEGGMRIMAFKALPRTSAVRSGSGSGSGSGIGSAVAEKKEKAKDQITAEAAEQMTLAAAAADENPGDSAREQIREVCRKIEKAVLAAMPDGGAELGKMRLGSEEGGEGGGSMGGGESGKGVLISEEDIISLKDAKAKTGLLEKWGYQVRKLVWA